MSESDSFLSTEKIKLYLDYLPEVKTYLSDLDQQDLWWTTVAMVGKINNENIDPQLLESIVETQREFQNLRGLMIKALVERYFNQASSSVELTAQAMIDILIRNLFERTADVGFLATDDDLVSFLTHPEAGGFDQNFIEKRIQEYVAKYSVYDDVVILDTQGQVRAKLNSDNPVSLSHDPLLQQALTTTEPYVEVYRATDLFAKSESLVYAKKIVDPKSNKAVGVLCLSFDFEGEMEGIFELLNPKGKAGDLALLNDQGTVLVSSNPIKMQKGRKLSHYQTMTSPEANERGFTYVSETQGYQGFKGLPWRAYMQADLQHAFGVNDGVAALDLVVSQDSPIYLHDLEEMNLKVSTLLLIVILNGKITSLKRDVKSFLPVLDSFQVISRDIQTIFHDFIEHIHEVLVKTIQAKLSFSTRLAIEIMDRNLYERANDCRWWALNSTFRQLLSTKQANRGELVAEDTQQLTQILHYINELYTVYTNILIYDTDGRVLAVSNVDQAHWVGQILPQSKEVAQCLGMDSTQRYVVSEFEETALYDNRPTYVYHAAIKHWQESHRNVGGIALVFDSEPEFSAMLQDTLPVYINESINKVTFSVFCSRQGHIIASTSEQFPVGSQLKLPSSLQGVEIGQAGTAAWKINDRNCVLGYSLSSGYREYKTQDGYVNDIFALSVTEI